MPIFALKLIALLAMLIDHVAVVLGTDGWDTLPMNSEWLRYIGRISFPIFAFCIVNGWTHSRDRKKYFQRLCLCAAVSQIPYSLAFYTPNLRPIGIGAWRPFYFHLMPIFLAVALLCAVTYWFFVLNKRYDRSIWCVALACSLPALLLDVNYMWLLSDSLNVLYTLALGMTVIYAIERYRSKMRRWEYVWLTAAEVLALLTYGRSADYGICLMGVILIAALYITREHRVMQSAAVALWGCLLYGVIIGNRKSALATVPPAILILLCNSKSRRNGTVRKYLFYGFYPAHLLLLGFINICFRLG